MTRMASGLKTECWHVGGDLPGAFHIVQVLVVTVTTSIISCCSKVQDGLTVWYQLTEVVLETGHYKQMLCFWCKQTVISTPRVTI